jgi:hypothetical protein
MTEDTVIAEVQEPPPEFNEHSLKYAIEWFTYHADQRYQAVLIYVIQLLIAPVALVCAAFLRSSGASIPELPLVFIAIGSVGIVVTIIFFLLDIRNAELVKVGEHILRNHELSMHEKHKILDYKREKYPRKNNPLSHGLLLRLFFVFGAVIYASVIFVSLANSRSALMSDQGLVAQNQLHSPGAEAQGRR